MNPKWLAGFPALSDILMRFGWFAAPFINGAEYDRLEALCRRIENVDVRDKAAMATAETEIFHVLGDPTYHPNYRAKFVALGIRLEHFNKFSHLYEEGIFSYYKRDYAGTVLLLLSALEGVLVALSGWQIGTGAQPGHQQLIRNVRESVPGRKLAPPLVAAHDMYRDVFANFLERWLYRHAHRADFGISVLNRHYVMHGLEPGNFYRPQDVHRMILAFDVLIDWLALNQGVFDNAFINTDNPIIARRMEYYHALSEGDQTVKQTWKAERTLLGDHPRYEPPTEEYDLEQSKLKAMMDILQLMSMTRRGKGPPEPPVTLWPTAAPAGTAGRPRDPAGLSQAVP